MPGLREKKKAKIRKDILKVSKKFFLEKGYDETSTKEIAQKAGIGAGTLFNYFPTKADILLEIISENVGDQNNEIAMEEAKTKSATEIIFNYILKFISPAMKLPKKIMRDFVVSSLKITKNKNNILSRVINADLKAEENIKKILVNLKADGLVSKDKDANILANIIFSTIFLEVSLYLFQEDIKKDRMYSNIKGNVEYLLT